MQPQPVISKALQASDAPDPTRTMGAYLHLIATSNCGNLSSCTIGRLRSSNRKPVAA